MNIPPQSSDEITEKNWNQDNTPFEFKYPIEVLERIKRNKENEKQVQESLL